ncbi:aromatic amino acid lyase [Rhodococcus sp. IC4_135]|nr:aromatic amino acid lyase [Rhodococcus sp. IC4_135]
MSASHYATTTSTVDNGSEPVVVDIGPVSFDEVVRVARHRAAVTLSDHALAAIAESSSTINELANSPTPVYGVSTGFGALATRQIPQELRTQLQRSLVRSHAAGSGPEVEPGISSRPVAALPGLPDNIARRGAEQI